MNERQQRLESALLYMICDDRPEELLVAALTGGVDILQLRMKSASPEEIVRAGRRLAQICAEHGALFILNDRPELVHAAGADGVHVGQDDVSVTSARELVGEERLVGLSTHTAQQVDAARSDYIGVGPVYATPTKPGRPAVGLELVTYAAENATVPFFAIGGISAENVDSVSAAGADRIAVVRALTEAPDPAQVACRLRGALSSPGRVGGALWSGNEGASVGTT